MAKSMRSKREKRLRAIRREIVEPFYDKKDAAKLAAQEAALAAPKVPVRTNPNSTSDDLMDATSAAAAASTTSLPMDFDMDGGILIKESLKPTSRISKKSKKGFKMGNGKRRGKGKLRRNRKI